MHDLETLVRAGLEARASEVTPINLRDRISARIRARGRRRRMSALALAFVVGATGVVGGWRLLGDDQATNQRVVTQPVTPPETTTTVAPVLPRPAFVWPDDCAEPFIGAAGLIGGDAVVERRARIPSWASSAQGDWLRDRLAGVGVANPYPAGSAFVIAHGVDGVAFMWFGPADDTAGLDLRPAEGVETAEVPLSQPFDTGAYRPATVDTIAVDRVRLWLLTHPHDGYEQANFPGLRVPAPCLPSQSVLRGRLREVAAASAAAPYDGSLPKDAGRLAINTDVGMSATDPGDAHLIRIATQALGRALEGPGSIAELGANVGIYSQIPPTETDPNTRAWITSQGGTYAPTRTTAGGLEILIYGGSNPLPDPYVDDLTRIAREMNRQPFVGQPTPS